MTNRLEEIQILLQKRIARARGPTSSADFNDTIDEISYDLANFSDQWSNRLVPLTDTIPNGEDDSSVDAFLNGLDGRTLYSNHEASPSLYSSYYNSTKTRPNTIYEQFTNIYSTIDVLQETLENQIDGLITSASMISILDTSLLYDATNVEDALSEAMTKINLIEEGALDLSAVAQHYIPATNNTYDIGSSAKRIRSIYFDTSLNMVNTASTKSFKWQVNANKLELLDGVTVVAQYDNTGVIFPQGAVTNQDLDDLTDVTIAAPALGELLQYDGAGWVNAAVASLTPGGAAGSVQYQSIAGTFAGDNFLFWDKDNYRLGVGTNAPDQTLHILQDANNAYGAHLQNTTSGVNAKSVLCVEADTADGFLNMYSSGYNIAFDTISGLNTLHLRSGANAEALILGTGATKPIHFLINDLPKMTLTNAGDLGLGTITPSSKCEIISSTATADTKHTVLTLTAQCTDPVQAGFGPQVLFKGETATDGSYDTMASIAAIYRNTSLADSHSDLAFFTTSGTDVLIERMRITASGYIGMGTASPVYPLHIIGSRGGTIALDDGTNPTQPTAIRGKDGDTWIDTLIPGSVFATTITSTLHGHCIVRLQANESSDSFSVVGNSSYDTNADPDKILFMVNSAGNAGIGVSAVPTGRLEVQGKSGSPCYNLTSSDTLAALRLYDSGSSADSKYFDIVNDANYLRIRSLTDAKVTKVDNIFMVTPTGKVGFGTATSPHAGVGAALISIEGADVSTSGPHVQFTTAADNYPILSIIPLSHASTSISTNAYYDGSWRSSSTANYPFQLGIDSQKRFYFATVSGVAAGNAITWVKAIDIDCNAKVGINTSAGSPAYPERVLDINSDSFRLRTAKTPASATAAGVAGEICWDSGFLYVCISANTWRRATLASW